MQKACEECGDYPLVHAVSYLNTSIELLLSSIPFPTFLYKSVYGLLGGFLRVGQVLHLVSYSEQSSDIVTERSRLIWEEARRRGLNVRQLMCAGQPLEFFEVRNGNGRFVFQSLPVPLSAYTDDADDKYKLKIALRNADIPSPRSLSTTTLKAAHRAFNELGRVCVKPRLGSNGRHTFPFVSTPEELEYAFISAQKLGRYVIVEEHLEGNLARATCVDGKLVGFLECVAPTVVGDGSGRISELIARANAERTSQAHAIELTGVNKKYLARRGVTLESVLRAGEKVPLGYWAGFSSGGSNKEYGTDIHPSLQAIIERAAMLTKLPVVGFDLIIQDPTKDPSEQSWGIIEANSIPFIELHHRHENPQNVAGKIWDMWSAMYSGTRSQLL
jgi:cyanophycin synthetase